MSHTNRNQNSENISTSSEQDKGVSQTHGYGRAYAQLILFDVRLNVYNRVTYCQ